MSCIITPGIRFHSLKDYVKYAYDTQFFYYLSLIGMDPVDYNRLPPSAPPVVYSPYNALACIVCGDYGSAPTAMFPCGCAHPIHDSCIGTWKMRNDTCPKCNQIWLNVLPPQAVIVNMPSQSIQIDRRSEANMFYRRCVGCVCLILCFIILIASVGLYATLIDGRHK